MALRDEVLAVMIQRAADIFRKNPADLGPDTSFVDDLKAKSVNLVQIATKLEDVFDVEITFMEFRRKRTFGEAADFVAGLIGE